MTATFTFDFLAVCIPLPFCLKCLVLTASSNLVFPFLIAIKMCSLGSYIVHFSLSSVYNSSLISLNFLIYNLYRNWPWQFQGMCSVCARFRSCVWPKNIVLLQARWKIVRTSSSLHTPHSTVNKVCLNWEKWQRGKCGVLFWAEFPTVSATVSTRSTFHLLQVSLLPIPFRNMGNPTETCTCKTFGEQKSICDSFDWKFFVLSVKCLFDLREQCKFM